MCGANTGCGRIGKEGGFRCWLYFCLGGCKPHTPPGALLAGWWLEHADKTNTGVMNLALGVAIWKLPSVFMCAFTYGRNASDNKVINLE